MGLLAKMADDYAGRYTITYHAAGSGGSGGILCGAQQQQRRRGLQRRLRRRRFLVQRQRQRRSAADSELATGGQWLPTRAYRVVELLVDMADGCIGRDNMICSVVISACEKTSKWPRVVGLLANLADDFVERS